MTKIKMVQGENCTGLRFAFRLLHQMSRSLNLSEPQLSYNHPTGELPRLNNTYKGSNLAVYLYIE